jgi:ribosomal protein S27E
MSKSKRYTFLKENGGVCGHCESENLAFTDAISKVQCRDCNYNSRKVGPQGLKEFIPSGFCVECTASFDDPAVDRYYHKEGPTRLCTECGGY